MKRNVILLGLSLLTGMFAQAQLIVAEECVVKDGDITAFRMNDQQPIVLDGDTIPYAIVRVGLVEPNAVFDSKWVLKQEYIDNEYWVFFMDGVKSVTIKTKRFTPLHYKFPEPLKAKSTYVMTLQKPDADKYKGQLNISSNVQNAQVFVDGVKVSDGTPFTYSGEGGPHLVELRADGFDSQQRHIVLPVGQQMDLTVNLFAAGSLSVDGISYGMVPVSAVNYVMGEQNGYYTSPLRNVSLRSFSVGSTMVSVHLWEKVMGEADNRIKGPHGQVVNVSFDDAQDFISALNAMTGKEFRLPTEAEWEYFARNAQQLGITDLGTSLEWCSDWFGKYSLDDSINPHGPDKGFLRSVRGGSEFNDYDPIYTQPYYRWRKQPDKSSPRISFRLVLDN